MQKDQQEEFVKIVIDLPDAEDGVGGEGVWSVCVGPDLYEIRNSPWHTLEYNFLDVVHAVSPAEDKNPVVQSLYQRGGHKAIHIVFLTEDKSQTERVLKNINDLGATYEGANSRLYALDLPPACSFDKVTAYLATEQTAEILEQRYAHQPQPSGSGDRPN